MKHSLPMKKLLPVWLASVLLFGIHANAQYKTKIKPDATHGQRMEWWREARFGLFIHWGLYSIPAGVWKGETAKKDYAEWAQNNFQIPFEEYSQLAKEFNPTKFNPDEWAELAEQAGMGYFVLTTKHHDGFAMYDSEVSDYNVVDATPYDKDVFAELAAAFRQRGMKACAYYSQDLDWSQDQGGAIDCYNTWDFQHDEPDQEAFDRYFHSKSLPQIKELSTKYGDIGLFWFDFPRMMNAERGKQILDLVREHQPNAIINSRLCAPQGLYADYLVPGDNGFFTSPQPVDWECCATMDESWGYKLHAHANRTATEIIQQLAGTVAAGGNLLLNIGPKPDGTIPQRQIDILKEIGSWMKDNRESIHGADANPFGEFFPWGVCTVKDATIYLHVKKWDDGGRITVPRLKNDVLSVEVLGDSGRKLDWDKQGEDLRINLSGKPVHESATVIKVSCGGSGLEIIEPTIAETDEGIILEARYARSLGEKMRSLRHYAVDGQVAVDASGGHPSEFLQWEIDLEKPGTFEVIAEFLPLNSGSKNERSISVRTGSGSELSFALNPRRVEGTEVSLGQLDFSQSGSNPVYFQVKGKADAAVYLKSLCLKRL